MFKLVGADVQILSKRTCALRVCLARKLLVLFKDGNPNKNLLVGKRVSKKSDPHPNSSSEVELWQSSKFITKAEGSDFTIREMGKSALDWMGAFYLPVISSGRWSFPGLRFHGQKAQKDPRLQSLLLQLETVWGVWGGGKSDPCNNPRGDPCPV